MAKKVNHPPDVVNVGATPDAQITDEQHQARMEGMDESQLLDYIDAMPPGTYARLTDGEMPPGA